MAASQPCITVKFENGSLIVEDLDPFYFGGNNPRAGEYEAFKKD